MIGLSALETQQIIRSKELALCFHHGMDGYVSPWLTPAICALSHQAACQQPMSFQVMGFGNYSECPWPQGRSTRMLLSSPPLQSTPIHTFQHLHKCLKDLVFSIPLLSTPNSQAS